MVCDPLGFAKSLEDVIDLLEIIDNRVLFRNH